MYQSDSVNSIIVLGGGTAGWLTAAVIAAEHDIAKRQDLTVTVVESPQVKTLGVGEGTWPTMRDTLRRIGISETEFLIRCDASFKQGTCFKQWTGTGGDDIYYHPFDLPTGFFESDLALWWAAEKPDADFADMFSAQPALCAAGKAPRQLQTPAYAAVANYGYHLDANKFSDMLREHCVDVLGVKHISAHVQDIQYDKDNYLTALRTEAGDIRGDLFVDCSGFAARLIGQHYGSVFNSVSDVLKNDTAMAVQAPYADTECDIASATVSTAHKNGWIWDIALPHRKGVGCVYSSEFCSDDEATETLLSYLKNDPVTAPVNADAIRKISFTPGYRETPWIKNCVAVGTSAGFFEPLEASALVMTELAALHIARQLPRSKHELAPVSRQFNRSFATKWQRIIDFLKLHYVLSVRTDSDYWQAMANTDSASDQLQDWLYMWQHRPINQHDFLYQDEVFPQASYLYILNGMGFAQSAPYHHNNDTNRFIQQNEKRKQQLLAGLPSNRDYLNALNQYRQQSAG